MAKATTHEIQAQTVAHIQRELAAVGAGDQGEDRAARRDLQPASAGGRSA